MSRSLLFLSTLFSDRALRRALRENLGAGLMLPLFAGAIVGAYYNITSIRMAFESLAQIRIQGGYLYSAIATGIFGGLIPFVYLRWKTGARFSHGLFFIGFNVYKGVEVDALYRLQAAVFGDSNQTLIVLLKIFFDQFVYNPFWSVPVALLAFHWKESDFDLNALRALPWRRFMFDRVGPALFSTWMVWIPTVAAVYSLPLALQIPLFNIVLCFWSLYFIALTRKA